MFNKRCGTTDYIFNLKCLIDLYLFRVKNFSVPLLTTKNPLTQLKEAIYGGNY